MHKRIKYLRKELLQMTQDQFASEIHLSRSNVGNIETNRIAITDRIITTICERFGVDEIWLRTGEGEPFREKTQNEKLAALMGMLLSDPDDTFQKRFISALLQLPPETWILLEDLLNKKD